MDDIQNLLRPHSLHDAVSRNIGGDKLAMYIKQHHPYHGQFDNLMTDGIIELDQELDTIQVRDIHEYLFQKRGFDGHVPYHSDGIERGHPRLEPRQTSFFSYDLETVIRAPHLMEFFTQPSVVDLAARYLGCSPTLYSVNLWWSFKGPTKYTRVAHRDYDDFRQVTVMVYLTDVEHSGHGPHIFHCGTHRGPATDVRQVYGPAGTAFMADTYAVHQGGEPETRDRLVAWARYGLHMNATSLAKNYKVFQPVSPESVVGRAVNTGYLTRGLIHG